MYSEWKVDLDGKSMGDTGPSHINTHLSGYQSVLEVDNTHTHALNFWIFLYKPACDSANPRSLRFSTIWEPFESIQTFLLREVYGYTILANIVYGYYSVNASSNNSILEALNSHDIILTTRLLVIYKGTILLSPSSKKSANIVILSVTKCHGTQAEPWPYLSKLGLAYLGGPALACLDGSPLFL